MRLLGIIGCLALVGASACTEIGPLIGPQKAHVTVYDCETGYSDALAAGGKSQAQIEHAFDQCLGQAMLKTGTDPEKHPIYIVRQTPATVVVSPEDYHARGHAPAGYGGAGYGGGTPGCPPGFRGMYRGTLYCSGY